MVDIDYVYRGAMLLAATRPTGTLHYSLDHLGTPRLITGDGGRVLGRHTYLPFGAEWTPATPDEGDAMKFTGHERDGSLVATESASLDYMHARYYSPAWARFLSPDPG